jgi:diguanylate cyclase (GGDEF)-like protein
MTDFLRIDINIISAILLLFVLYIAYKRLNHKETLNKVFFVSTITLISLLTIESITCIINQRQEPWVLPTQIVLHVLLFSAAPILTFFLFVFIAKMVYTNYRFSKRIIWTILGVLFANFIFNAFAPLHQFTFYFDEMNTYHRGNLFWFNGGLTYIFVFFSLFFVFKHRKKILKEEFHYFLIFAIIPLLGGLVQGFFYGTLMMWSSGAFALIFIYIFMQDRLVRRDELTGTWTRDSFQYFINRMIKQTPDIRLGGMFVDINNLKGINDHHGHYEGDFAIKTIANCICSSIHQGDIVARFGGDEFVVVTENATLEQLEKISKDVQQKLADFNNNQTKRYQLQVSFGLDLYSSEFDSFDAFYIHLDRLMYEEKMKSKMQTKNIG